MVCAVLWFVVVCYWLVLPMFLRIRAYITLNCVWVIPSNKMNDIIPIRRQDITEPMPTSSSIGHLQIYYFGLISFIDILSICRGIVNPTGHGQHVFIPGVLRHGNQASPPQRGSCHTLDNHPLAG